MIERANKNDLPEILELQKLTYQENAVRYNDPEIPPLRQTLDELVTAMENNYIFLKAVTDGVIVGSVRGYLKDNSAVIEKLFVHPDYQNQGIGRKLMQSIEQEFDVTVFRLVTGHLDEKNISLYSKLRYVIYGETEQISPTLSFVKMEKKLKGENNMNCANVKECACPKTECPNYGKCCDCVLKHRETDSLPFCLFMNNDGDKSVSAYYKKLKERFDFI